MPMVLANATTAGTIVKDAVTGIDFTPVLSEVTALIPVVIPVAIGFLAVRKGISFLIGTLQSA